MDFFILASLSIALGAICGVFFVIYKIIEEERERREKESMVKVHYKHYKKDGTCSECGCRPCRCEP
jgi:hypothetical protein